MDKDELTRRLAEVAQLQRQVDRGTIPLNDVRDEILSKLLSIEILTGVGGETLYGTLRDWARAGWARSVPRNNDAEIETWRAFLVEVRGHAER